VLREGRSDDPQALLDWVNTRVGKQQRLADCVAVKELPRNPNGKILKRELRQLHGDKRYA
jgi:acyl-coenzyme A synthetase/AMP-(fatty) acid ligase